MRKTTRPEFRGIQIESIHRGHLAAGSSLPEAFMLAGRRAGDALSGAAERVEEMLAAGGSFVDTMDTLRAEFDDPIADRVLATLVAAHRSGGPRG